MYDGEGDFSAALASLERSGHRPRSFSRPFVDLLPVNGAAVSTLGPILGSETLSATDEKAVRLDELQFDLGEGPCWDAMNTSRPVLVASLGASDRERWPMFGRAQEVREIGSLFAFPLVVGPLRLGAVDLYSIVPSALAASDVHRAGVLAEVISRHILRRALGEHALAVEEQQPLSRRVVHHATGFLLAQLELSPEDAQLVIQGQAFATGRPMMEVAEDIVSGRLVFAHREGRIEVDSGEDLT